MIGALLAHGAWVLWLAPLASTIPCFIPTFEQIPYGSSDLARIAINFRKLYGITGARNVAVFEYKGVDGILRTIVKASEWGVGHAERLIAYELESMGVEPSQVTRIYTELEPCNAPGGWCRHFIFENFSHVLVTYSFEYGDTWASRRAGITALKEAVQKIFQ